jgi:type II secretory pathway predicted ATPase ExeA
MNLRQLVERGDRPFATQPQVGRYFPAASIEDARRRLARTIERGDGPGVILGGAGIGKSLLLQALAAQYREKFDVVLLACSQLCTRRALLQAIHFELGLDYHRRDEGELRLSLLDTLLSSDDATQGLLLLVDEGQALAIHLLEELRLLTNLSRGGSPRVRLVMAGLPALEEKLAGPELQSFSQRLSARCYLAPFTRAETAQYVRAQLAASHADADQFFAPPAFDSIFTATDGVPRLVNQICDRALEFADAKNLEKIDAAVIQAAWADLQQLPTSWEPPRASASSSSASSNVVEFGSLSAAPAAVEPPKVRESKVEPAQEAAPAPVAEKTKVIASAPTPTTLLPPAPRPTVRRPRVFSQPAPDAIDPFAEEFEEEELVLDSFATLASIFGTRTPRVDNGREPGFSRLVQHALDANSAKEREEPAEIAESDDVESDQDLMRATIRLAVVNDSPTTIVDDGPQELEFEAVSQPGPAATLMSDSSHVADDAILVIEDEPAPPPSGPQPGVRREGYRQLFSRLRHGT